MAHSRSRGESRLGVLLGRPYRTLRNEILSFRHALFDAFEFIHINRTGGTSIINALGLPFEHATAREVIGRIGQRRWDERFSFAVVRNPWDKVVSHYHHRVQTNQTQLGAKPIPFGAWLVSAYRDRNPQYYDKPLMFAPQVDWISGLDGLIVVDFICRFEDLEHDFEIVTERIGRRVILPHLNRSNHGDYREYYNDEMAAIVATWFRKDIEMFGYTL